MLGMPPKVAKEKFGTEKAADADAYEGKGTSVNYYSFICTICDVLGMCKFHAEWLGNPMTMKMMAELFSAVTGEAMDEDGLFEVAARVNNMNEPTSSGKKSRKDDIISGRAMDEPISTGNHKG